MEKMTFTPASELYDEVWGPIGTPARDAVEERIKEEADACFLGETIKKERVRQSLTQEQLGERVGVNRAQICNMEDGKGDMTISVLSRVFRALGIPSGTLDLGVDGGRVALW